VEIGSDILRATVVAYYGRKPPELLDFLVRVQARIGIALGGAFKPYEPQQIHATIVGLEGVLRRDQLLNQNFLTLRGQARAVSLSSVLDLLHDTELLPMEIQIGGFRPGVNYGFFSRGLSPNVRSFSLRNGIAVGIGWPVADGQYPDTLDRLRRAFQNIHVLHKYHQSAGDVDNDLYFVLGRHSSKLNGASLEGAEREIARYFSANPRVVPLRLEDLSVACYTDESLPMTATAVLPATCDSGAAARAIQAGSLAPLSAS
jgi:hypothetical protein